MSDENSAMTNEELFEYMKTQFEAINTRFDALEKAVEENTMAIQGQNVTLERIAHDHERMDNALRAAGFARYME